MAEPAETADAAPAGKSKKKLFVVIGAVVVLLGGGGAAAWFLTRSSPPPGDAKFEAPKAPVFLPLETFTVNLQGDEQKYLQTDITLQMADEAQVDTFKQQMPRVRSRLLALLSSKHAAELVSPENKKKLTQEIMAQLNQPFYPHGKPQQVVDVLFTTFVIQ